MSQLHLLKYNQAATINFNLFDLDGVDMSIAATFAAGDLKIMKDEGAEANTTNLPTDEGSGYSLVLTATEMSAARVMIHLIDQTATKVWLDTSIVIETYGNASATHAFDLDTANVTLAAVTHTGATVPTVTTLTTKTGFSLASTGLDAITQAATGMIEIAKAVWDRVLTGGTHNINNSAGRRLRTLSGFIISDGKAQSGSANTIQLASGAVTANDEFIRARVILTDGTGAGQEAIITSSVASTDTLTITPAWRVNPDATSDYDIMPALVHSAVMDGGYDNGQVYIDTINGSAGTQKGVNGTSTNPVDNLTDAYTIGSQESISHFVIESGSALTLPSDTSNKVFSGGHYTLALNGQEIGGAIFIRSNSVTGIAIDTSSGTPGHFTECGFGTCTLPPSTGIRCFFAGTLTMQSAGDFRFVNCTELTNSTVIIDYGSGLNSSNVYMTEWGGGTIEIQNAGAGTGSYRFEMNGNGALTVNANCSATTTVLLRGSISRNADVTGIVYDEVANLNELQDDWADGGRLDLLLDRLITEIDTATTEPGQEAPGVSIKRGKKIDYIYKFLRNRVTSTSTTISVYADDATTIDQKTAHSDDGTTYDRGEFGTGP